MFHIWAKRNTHKKSYITFYAFLYMLIKKKITPSESSKLRFCISSVNRSKLCFWRPCTITGNTSCIYEATVKCTTIIIMRPEFGFSRENDDYNLLVYKIKELSNTCEKTFPGKFDAAFPPGRETLQRHF